MSGTGRQLSVVLLADHPGFVDNLVQWYESEWGPYYGPRGPGDARADLESRCNRRRLPIGFVALRDNRLLGTAALDRDPATGKSPSIVGLLVAPDFRHTGVASALLDFAEGLARELGYNELFMSTAILGEHVKRRGWQEQGGVEFLNDQRGTLYVCPLTMGRSP